MLKLPLDERVALLRDAAARERAARRGRALQPRSVEGHDRPPPLWDERVRRSGRAARAREAASRDPSPTSPPSAVSRRPTRCSTSPSPRTSRRSSAGARRARSGPKRCATAQLDPRMLIGTSDGGAHLARDDGADWSSYFLRSWVLDRRVWTLEEGHPPDHAGACGAARSCTTGAPSGSAAGPT